MSQEGEQLGDRGTHSTSEKSGTGRDVQTVQFGQKGRRGEERRQRGISRSEKQQEGKEKEDCMEVNATGKTIQHCSGMEQVWEAGKRLEGRGT